MTPEQIAQLLTPEVDEAERAYLEHEIGEGNLFDIMRSLERELSASQRRVKELELQISLAIARLKGKS